MVEPAILGIRAVALGNLATLLFFAAFGAMILASTLFLSQVWRHSVLRAGMEIAPGPVMAAIFAVPGGLLAARHGARFVGLAGSLLFASAGSCGRCPQAPRPTTLSAFAPGGIIAGIGAGLVLPSLSAAATLPLPPERFATGTAMMSMGRQVGLALGVAVVTAVLGARPDVGAFSGLRLLEIGLNASRILIATTALGVARRMRDHCMTYAKTKPLRDGVLMDSPVFAQRLGQMEMQIDVMKATCSGRPATSTR